MKPCAVFDLGGTKTLVGVVSAEGSLLCRTVIPTPKTDCESVLARCRTELTDLLAQAGMSLSALCGLGVSLPGMVDSRRGLLLHAPFAGWRNVDVAACLAQLLPSLPMCMENDVNACALGEMRFGAGKNCQDLLWMTVSTGVGGAIVADGRLLHGAHQVAGEIGHVCVERTNGARCTCGGLGCLEAQASGSAMTRYVREACETDAALKARFAEENLSMDAKGAAVLAKAGDERILALFARCGRYLGRGIAAAVNLLDPELVVLGGGMAASLPFYHEALLGAMAQELRPDAVLPRVCETPLGYDAAAIGAAALLFDHVERMGTPCLG